ncbi:hypothetical protein AMATHDRAFT_53091 [Amanita thiersii Skay4041]|uniref:Uncharacterized protein n=1 Tax=Amanita thiersii Skay4041 TaxID=703135 RepID=A0A2A9P106_9AGAR|nr:hypothetical protein AMATHDRAFT_53091 [Amanita thiersii Skay4041]
MPPMTPPAMASSRASPLSVVFVVFGANIELGTTVAKLVQVELVETKVVEGRRLLL